MNALFRKALAFQGAYYNAFFLRTLDFPEACQARILKAILKENADTVFGREHQLHENMSIDEFRSAVPIRGYEELKSYTDRVEQGHAQILSREQPRHFAATSGTTGAPKLIPITPRWQAQLRQLNRLWLYRASIDSPGCFDHGVVMIVSNATEGHTPSGKSYGAMSGIAYERLSRVAGSGFVVPYLLTHIDDMQIRYFCIMRFALAQRVSAIGTANPTTLLRLAEALDTCADQLIDAIRHGMLGIDKNQASTLDPLLLEKLQKLCVPDAQRAAALEKCRAEQGVLRPKDAWPELRLIGCWLGGSAGRHSALLSSAYGSVARRDLGFMASEGRFSLPLTNGTATGVLTTSANFYDFVDEDADDTSSARSYLAHELERGKRYRIIVTSLNGLWRYDMNDIVEVTGFAGRTPMIAFVRKGGDIVSIVGEKLHINHLQSAMSEIERDLTSTVIQFRVIPDVDSFRHDLLIEFTDRPAQIHDLGRRIDRALAQQNEEYASKRRSERLKMPRILLMQAGWADAQIRRDIAAGKRDSQYKWRSVTDTWDENSRAAIIEEIVDV